MNYLPTEANLDHLIKSAQKAADQGLWDQHDWIVSIYFATLVKLS